MEPRVSVLIVDDSSIVRHALQRELSRQPGIRVAGTAPDPFVARDMILQHKPDVLTPDIEMPRMDGLTFLRRFKKHHPLPVIVVSSLAARGRAMAIACLGEGAVDLVSKPNESSSIGDVAGRLGDLIRGAARAKLRTPGAGHAARAPAPSGTSIALAESTRKVVAPGASTGGPEALRIVLEVLPRQCPGVLITQHMPEEFTASFAERLNSSCKLEVKEAVDGDVVVPGRALLAPGNRHLKVDRDGARYIVRVVDGPRVSGHRPSVDVLFE